MIDRDAHSPRSQAIAWLRARVRAIYGFTLVKIMG